MKLTRIMFVVLIAPLSGGGARSTEVLLSGSLADAYKIGCQKLGEKENWEEFRKQQKIAEISDHLHFRVVKKIGGGCCDLMFDMVIRQVDYSM